jgi:NAD(P)H-dependent FMN reductase
VQADGLVLSVPEYAFGIPGAFKNAFDWIVPSFALAGKPVAVLNVSPPRRGLHVQACLRLVLTALAADIIEHSALSVPVMSRQLGADSEVADAAVLERLRRVVRLVAERSQHGREPATRMH